MIRILSYY
jgi:hypothetical protein